MTQRLHVTRRALLGAAAFGAGFAALSCQPAAAAPAAASRPAAAPRTINAATRGAVGISANSGILWESVTSQAASLDFMRAIGVTGIRIDIPWRWIEATRRTFTWTLVDRVVDAARARGMSVLGVFTTAPQWASGSSNPQVPPADLTQWATFVRTAVTRYRGKVYAYEVWNEPNGSEYYAPGPDPSAYAALVRAAAPAIKQADPQAIVIAGVLGPAPDGYAGMMPAVPFFRAMLDAGVGDAVDAYSFHPYDDDHTMAQAAYWDNTAIRQAMEMHTILRARGEGQKKIWATEYGAPAALGEQRQAELIVTGIQQWQECAFTGPMYLHHHRDQFAGDSYGLATSGLVPRPAAFAVQGLHVQQAFRQYESVVFEDNADPALGAAMSPVYALAGGFAQDHEEGGRFLGPFGWLSAPTAITDLLRRANRQPAGSFNGQWQDVHIPESPVWPAARAFASAAGAYLVSGSILEAWDATLGNPTGAQAAAGNAVVQNFERGSISWQPGVPVVVTRF